MTTGAIDRSLLEQVLKNLDSGICVVPAGILHKQIRTALAAPTTAPDLSDAYIGAREDLAIWKKRALEAEETARQLAHALAEEVNGPTFMADPVKPAPAQPSWQDAPTKPGVWFCDEGDICYTWTAHNIEILDQFDPGDGLRWFGPIPEDKP